MVKQLLILIFVYSLNLNSYGVNPTVEKYTRITDISTVESTILELTTGITSIKSDFIQKKHLDALEMVIESKGALYYRSDNSLKWEYTEPFSYTIVSYNKKFIIKNEDNISEYDIESNIIFREINSTLVKSVNGELLSDRNFKVEGFIDSSKGYKFILYPTNEMMSSVISSIEIFWKEGDRSVSRVKMMEDTNNYTEITFYNKELNAEIPDTTFTIN